MLEFRNLSAGKQSKKALLNVLKSLRHFRHKHFRQKIHQAPKILLLAEGNGRQRGHLGAGSGLRLWIPVLQYVPGHNLQSVLKRLRMGFR